MNLRLAWKNLDRNIKLAIILIIILIFISLTTKFYGSTDTKEYMSTAKFFAGMSNSKVRASHSMFYGFINAPLIYLFKNFFIMKLVNLFFLVLIIISVYYLSNKNKKALFLIVASPVIWYMGPWINPIQIATLLFLWSYFFITKFDKTLRNHFLIYAGILAGLSVAFWNSTIYMILFLCIAFFYNKKVSSLVIFLFFVIVGLIPLFILEQILFGFFLFSITKTFLSNIHAVLYGSIYPGVLLLQQSFLDYLIFLIMLPIFSYVLFYKKIFSKNKKTMIFLILAFLFLMTNPQIRYLLLLYPILILSLAKNLNRKQFKIQVIVFLFISLLVINPYLIQIKYSTNSKEFAKLIDNFGNWEIYPNQDKIILQDLKEIIEEYPNQIFVVGNNADDYAPLAAIYWGNKVNEFVSIQDYKLVINNESNIFKKKFESNSSIQNRRQIWIEGGISKNENDDTDYENISFGIGIKEPIEIKGFTVIEKYNLLYLSKKE